MNPIALRLSEMAVTLEKDMPEIAAALEVAEREIIRLEALVPPKTKHLVMICGVDCHPHDDICNNYCNMAPEKGPMAKSPPPGPDSPSGLTTAQLRNGAHTLEGGVLLARLYCACNEIDALRAVRRGSSHE
jgi:hypothetical protein